MPVMLGGESAVCDIRGLRCHLRHWGPRNAPLVMLLHGWMDAGASWQFVAERLAADWHCVAVDWRGFGESQWAPDGVYAYPDFLVDLDVLLDQLTPGEPARLVGHSMGGNLCAWYAAARPECVRSLVCVEGFGLRAYPSTHAASYLRDWLADARRSPAWRPYEQLEDVVARVRERSSRVSPERALIGPSRTNQAPIACAPTPATAGPIPTCSGPMKRSRSGLGSARRYFGSKRCRPTTSRAMAWTGNRSPRGAKRSRASSGSRSTIADTWSTGINRSVSPARLPGSSKSRTFLQLRRRRQKRRESPTLLRGWLISFLRLRPGVERAPVAVTRFGTHSGRKLPLDR